MKNPDEEVFAESYDDQEELPAPKPTVNTNTAPAKIAMVTTAEAMEQIKYMGYPCCPNKWNIYHECLPWCQNKWNKNRSTGPEPGSEYESKYKVSCVPLYYDTFKIILPTFAQFITFSYVQWWQLLFGQSTPYLVN